MCSVSQCTLPTNCVLHCTFETFQEFRCYGSCIDFSFCIFQKWLTVCGVCTVQILYSQYFLLHHVKTLTATGSEWNITDFHQPEVLQVSHCWFTGHLRCCYPDWLDLTQQDVSLQLSYLQQQLQHLLSLTENESCVSVYYVVVRAMGKWVWKKNYQTRTFSSSPSY